MKKIFFVLVILIISKNVFASPSVITPVAAQPDFLTSQAVAGVGPTGQIVPLSVDSNGNLSAIDASVATLNFKTTITLAGAANRTQLASHDVKQCFFQAPLGNTGMIYLGGSTVTNTSGANEGIAMVQGDVSPWVSMANTNEIYFAADTANDVVKVFCK